MKAQCGSLEADDRDDRGGVGDGVRQLDDRGILSDRRPRAGGMGGLRRPMTGRERGG